MALRCDRSHTLSPVMAMRGHPIRQLRVRLKGEGAGAFTVALADGGLHATLEKNSRARLPGPARSRVSPFVLNETPVVDRKPKKQATRW
jgi:hypothetical protein